MALNSLGTVRPGSTLVIPYSTYDSNDPSKSVTNTELDVGAITVFKDGSLTQRTSTSGEAVDIDVDGIVGTHWITIDLSDNDHAGFYAAGSRYVVILQGLVIDAATAMSTAVATFDIGYPNAIINTTVASVTSQTQFILTVGPAEADALIGCKILFHDVASAVQLAYGYITDYIVTTKEVICTDPVGFTFVATDNVSIFLPDNVHAVQGTTQTAGDIIGDTNDIQTRLPAALVNSRMDSAVDATGFEQGAIDNVWDEPLTGSSHNVATSSGRRLRQVEEAFVHANGTIATVTNGHTFTLDAGAVATADYYIGDRLQIVEGTGAGQSRIIVAYTSGKVVTLDSDFTTNPDTSSLYEVVAADVHVSVSDADLAEGFVATYTDTVTITLDTTIAVATTDYYLGQMIVFTHGTGAGQSRIITGYTSGRVVTMAPPLTTALDTTTTWHIVAADTALLEDSLVRSTAKAGTLSTTAMSTNLGEATDDHYIDRTIIWLTGVLKGQISTITDYVGVNGVLTYAAVTEAPSAGDAFLLA